MTACNSPDRDPAHLHPDLRVLWVEFQERNRVAGNEVFLTATWRDPAAQLAEWQKGRDADGNIIDASQVVTHAKPGQSAHECTMNDDGVTPGARAFDFALQLGDEGNQLDWDADDPQWVEAILIGKELGLINGKNFPTSDADHFELANWKTYQLGAGLKILGAAVAQA